MEDLSDGGVVEGLGGANYETSKGTYSTMWVPLKTSTPCQRISCIYVQTDDGGSAEFGWIQGVSNCTQQRYDRPVVFSWNIDRSGSFTCSVFPTIKPTPGKYVSFKVLVTGSTARNYVDGEQVGGAYPLDWNEGHSFAATERNTSADDCYAEWRELKEYHPANSWTY